MRRDITGLKFARPSVIFQLVYGMRVTGEAGIMTNMDRANQRGKFVTRVIRASECAPAKWTDDVSTPESRMEAVWDLTLMCLAWRRGPVSELRLQRSVVRIQRARR